MTDRSFAPFARTDITRGIDLDTSMALAASPYQWFVRPSHTGAFGTGRTYDRPLQTLQEAIDKAEDDRGDVIWVGPGTQTVTETVSFNKDGITVVAMQHGSNPWARGEYHALLADTSFTDGPVATVTSPCTIMGLGFVSRDTGSTFYSGAAMLVGGQSDATPFGVHVYRCRFPKWNVDNRIGVAVEGSANVTIQECDFEGVGADFDAGVYVQGATQNLNILGNHFRQCTAAVQTGAFAGGGPHVFIGKNVVEDGLLLDTQGNSGNGLVYGNWLETATDTSSYDRSVNTLQGDGWNFSGNNYTE